MVPAIQAVANVSLVPNRSRSGVAPMKLVSLASKANKYVFCCCAIKLTSTWLLRIFSGLLTASCRAKTTFFKGPSSLKTATVSLTACSHSVTATSSLSIFVSATAGNSSQVANKRSN